ncbi:MAG: class I SAM-dependent methyltransferase [Burkholderiales bacterium]|nr:class I SAM-dependent methyltransferase [Burkholderiales bacterium]
MKKAGLQYAFSQEHASTVFNASLRRQKALKTLAVLEDHLHDLSNLDALEIGSAAGYCTVHYAARLRHISAVDIDLGAMQHALQHNPASNVSYFVMDAQHLAFPDATFDIVICMHVYEHVPDATALMGEIDRVLKPGGVCYFTAGNRLSLIEPHYRLPLLSALPKPLSHLYLRLLHRGTYYYENHLTYWGLKKLVVGFENFDYTVRVVKSPEKFRATEVIRPHSMKQKFSILFLKIAYWLCPTYLWLLKKSKSQTS